jgi:hypothetical protein
MSVYILMRLLFSSLASLLVAAPTIAQDQTGAGQMPRPSNRAQVIESVEDRMVRCLYSDTAQENVKHSQLLPNLKVYEMGRQDPPWSTPYILRDSFLDQEVAMVSDHYYETNYMSESIHQVGVISQWGQRGLKVGAYWMNRAGSVPKTFNSLIVKVGNEIFSLSESNGSFTVTSSLATALMQSSDVQIRVIANSGQASTFPIGNKTIESWRSIRNGLRAYCKA